MTDASSFYLLLAAFYVSGCFRLVPTDWQGFGVRASRNPKSRARPAFLEFAGVGKWVYFRSLFPTFSLLVAAAAGGEMPSTQGLGSTRRKLQRALLATRCLRWIGLAIFAFFFAVLPAAYLTISDEILFLTVVLYGYFLMWMAAGDFFVKHRRFYPDDSSERWMEVLLISLLPWHAMRAADKLADRLTEGLDQTSLLILGANFPSNTKQLRTLWIKTPTPALATLLQQNQIDPTPWTQPPTLTQNQKWCPACNTIYDTPSEPTCTDCNSPLLP